MNNGQTDGGTTIAPMEDTTTDGSPHIAVRATVHLSGLPCGKTAIVDPSHPYIAELIAAEYLVPTDNGGDVQAASDES